jgi:AcrR family transcriptional regulator
MGRRREHGEETRTALLEAAERTLATAGPAAVSARGLAEATGTTTRAVYSVFGSMELLLQELCRRGYLALMEEVGAVPETDDPAADLVRVGLAFRRFAVAEPHLFRLAFERVTPNLSSESTVAAAAVDSYRQLLGRVRPVLEPQGASKPATMLAAMQFHGLCQGLATVELQAQSPPVGSGFWPLREPIAGEAFWTQALEDFVRGLRSR